MLLFFAIDVHYLNLADLWLLTAVFCILEFLLLVACNAIQVVVSFVLSLILVMHF
jgi:hypothetical protein